MLKKKKLKIIGGAFLFWALVCPPFSQAALPECVDLGQPCVIGGTPCCDFNDCKGEFPHTTCQEW